MLPGLSVVKVQKGDPRVDPFIRGRHYLRKWPAVTPHVFCLLHDGRPVGVICFSFPPKQANVRYGCEVLELSRLWVSDEMPTNTESWFISQSVGQLRSLDRKVGGIVTYADPSVGHAGAIYRASNFIPDGRTDQERKTPRFDYEANGVVYSRRAHVPAGAEVRRVPRVSKHRFFLPLHACVRRQYAARRAA